MNKDLFLYYFVLTVVSTQMDLEIAIRAFLDITGLIALLIFIGRWLKARSKKKEESQSAPEGQGVV